MLSQSIQALKPYRIPPSLLYRMSSPLMRINNRTFATYIFSKHHPEQGKLSEKKITVNSKTEKKIFPIAYRFFGAKNKYDRKLIRAMLYDFYCQFELTDSHSDIVNGYRVLGDRKITINTKKSSEVLPKNEQLYLRISHGYIEGNEQVITKEELKKEYSDLIAHFFNSNFRTIKLISNGKRNTTMTYTKY